MGVCVSIKNVYTVLIIFLGNSPKPVVVEGLEEEKEWLKQNATPWELVEDNWKITAEKRQGELKNDQFSGINRFLEDWPLYKRSFGKQLVSKIILF